MSQTKTRRRTSWVGWFISALLIVGSVWLWFERQYVVDAVQYYQFKPSQAIEKVADEAGLTDSAKFTFYAVHPVIESSKPFNRHCQRREANSPILGCYAAGKIYIFDVTDERLDGLKTVTAAHELLHAEYDRLPESEKKRLEPLLMSAYKKVATKDLDERMKYYEKTEPGESVNELHSIIGTEFPSIGGELEQYYKKYFKDRQAIVTLHDQVQSTFDTLSKEADTLINQIEKLATTINNDTSQYNTDIEELNTLVDNFNKKAAETGGFTTQAEFQSARQELLVKSNELSSFRQKIQSNIATYKTLITKLDAINAKSAALNQSLDSSLSDAPKI